MCVSLFLVKETTLSMASSVDKDLSQANSQNPSGTSGNPRLSSALSVSQWHLVQG